MRYLIVFLALAVCCGCVSRGAGSQQDPCGLAEVKASAPGGTAQAQQQSLQSGQRASNQPVQSDPAKWSPATVWGGGAGAVSAENTWAEDRAQAGAPSSNMMLVQPASQDQSQQAVGGCHPQIYSLDRQLKAANMRLSVALSKGDMTAAEHEYKLIADLNDRYAQATLSTAKNVTIHYDFANAYITQGMSSASTASGKPGSAETTGDGTSVAPTAAELTKQAGATAPSTAQPAVGTVIRVPPGTVPAAPSGESRLEAPVTEPE